MNAIESRKRERKSQPRKTASGIHMCSNFSVEFITDPTHFLDNFSGESHTSSALDLRRPKMIRTQG